MTGSDHPRTRSTPRHWRTRVPPIWSAAVAVLLAACTGEATSEGTPTQVDGDLAFVGVSVLPMTGEADVLEDQTVVIRDGRIAWMGSADDAELGDGMTQVDGSGRYLLPGLAEMHAHVPGDNAPADLTEDILFLYLANGITTMRGMLGAPGQLELRRRIAEGDLLGPRFIVGAPSANGNSTPTPEAAEQHMRDAAEAGYDFMKIHPGIPRDAWDRLIEVGNEVGLTLAGHVPVDVGLEHAVTSGIQTVDHLDGYLQSSLSAEARERFGEQNLGVIPTSEILAAVDPAEVERLVALTAEQGTWQVPTMYLWENFYAPTSPEEFLGRPGMEYVPESMRQGWVRQKEGRPASAPGVAEDMASMRLNLLTDLYEAGVPILMGTDAPQMFNVPGFSLHHEIEVMARAMPARAVLEAGTRNVAGYMEGSLGLPANFGTVAVGMDADLILAAENPLDDLGTLARPEGVMARGQWLDRQALDARLEALAQKYQEGS